MTTKYIQLLTISLVLLGSCIKCEDQDTDTHNDLNTSQVWGYGFLAGLGISLIGFATALIIVCVKKCASDGCFELTIKFLFSLAFGALLGDAMIHILPQAYTVEGSDPRVVAAIFISAIVFFLILERVFEACGITHQHWHSNQCHDDHQGAIQNHNHPNRVQVEDIYQPNQDGSSIPKDSQSNNLIMVDQSHSHRHKCKQNHSHKHEHGHENGHGHNHEHQNGNQNPHQHCNHDHQHTKENDQQQDKDKSCIQNLKGKGTAGYMNLLGSLIHNFMDGLALGVAFATANHKVFVPILVAIIAHEIPREMGDVAILMTNKFNGTQTVLCNGFVNLMSLLGVIIGLAITDLTQVAKQYILVFVAGNFIYIAADIWRHLFKNSGFAKNLLEFIGFGIGVGSMYLILLLESDEEGHQH